jgi:hypothetical protein
VDLIVFAHRAEAKSFLSEGSFKAMAPNLYEGSIETSLCFILITGEGNMLALSSLSHSLGLLADRAIKRVINYGVAGSLDQALCVGELYPIRTIYRQGHDESSESMEFKSFTSQIDGVDLVTTHKRVLDKKQHLFLSHFAPIVEREAWALAFAAKLATTPFLCFKVISDYADNQEICQIVKEQAAVWSDKMLEHYQNLSNTSPKEHSLPELIDDKFHVTTAQERILHKLLQALSLKGLTFEQIFEQVSLITIKEMEGRKKERTKRLIDELTTLLNPLHHALEQKLKALTHPMKQQDIKASFDPSFEEEKINLSVTIRDEKHRDQVATALQEFDYHKLRTLLSGQNLDV